MLSMPEKHAIFFQPSLSKQQQQSYQYYIFAAKTLLKIQLDQFIYICVIKCSNYNNHTYVECF